ncbi:helix-turn-helix domain-containing protein [Bradyrhizobium lupini]
MIVRRVGLSRSERCCRSPPRPTAEADYSERRATCHQDVQIFGKGCLGAIALIGRARRDRPLKVQGQSIQQIGRRLGRADSTVSRELRRNGRPRRTRGPWPPM